MSQNQPLQYAVTNKVADIGYIAAAASERACQGRESIITTPRFSSQKLTGPLEAICAKTNFL